MTKTITWENLPDFLEALGFDANTEVDVLPDGVAIDDDTSGLQVVFPLTWQVGVDHQLMNPAVLLPDIQGRIPKALGQRLPSLNYGFWIGRFEAETRQFFLWDATADRLDCNTSHVVVCSQWDRTVGDTSELRSTDIKRIGGFMYHHEYYDDPVYKISGVQTFIMEVSSHPQLKSLVEQTLKNQRCNIEYANKAMAQFEAGKDRVAQQILKELKTLSDLDLPEGYQLSIYSDSTDWVSWVIYELPKPSMHSFEDFLTLRIMGGNRYWYDQPSATQCKEDVKVAKQRIRNMF